MCALLSPELWHLVMERGYLNETEVQNGVGQISCQYDGAASVYLNKIRKIGLSGITPDIQTWLEALKKPACFKVPIKIPVRDIVSGDELTFERAWRFACDFFDVIDKQSLEYAPLRMGNADEVLLERAFVIFVRGRRTFELSLSYDGFSLRVPWIDGQSVDFRTQSYVGGSAEHVWLNLDHKKRSPIAKVMWLIARMEVYELTPLWTIKQSRMLKFVIFSVMSVFEGPRLGLWAGYDNDWADNLLSDGAWVREFGVSCHGNNVWTLTRSPMEKLTVTHNVSKIEIDVSVYDCRSAFGLDTLFQFKVRAVNADSLECIIRVCATEWPIESEDYFEDTYAHYRNFMRYLKGVKTYGSQSFLGFIA